METPSVANARGCKGVGKVEGRLGRAEGIGSAGAGEAQGRTEGGLAAKDGVIYNDAVNAGISIGVFQLFFEPEGLVGGEWTL